MSLPQRKSPRLTAYDYTQEQTYFVTICTQGHVSLFGHITEQTMRPNPAGEMIDHWWQELPNKFADVHLDHWMTMPNHFHGIISLNRYESPDQQTSLSGAIGWFKTMTTNAYIKGVKTYQWPAYEGRLWQRSYHDHVIRNEADLRRIQEYVVYNPWKWREDVFYIE